MACMHMQTTHSSAKSHISTIPSHSRCRQWPMRRVTARSSTHDSIPGATEVARILHQHKLLMEHGFSYDQASLILQLSERRSMQSADVLEGQVPAAQPSSAVTAHSISANQPEDHSTTDLQQQQQQQQQGVKAIEDRLSFLEMELLKQSIAVDAVSNLAGLADPDSSSSSSSSRHHLSQHGMPAAAAAGDLQAGLVQLDPEVLALAEALLIRQGRVLPAPGCYSNPTTADSVLYRQPRQQHEGAMGYPYSSSSSNSSVHAHTRVPSSIWGRRHAARQLKAKPWRYSDEPLNPSSTTRVNPGQQMLPYGYMPDGDMTKSHDLEYHDLEFAHGDDLVPYEPSGWSVAGTVLLVYAGVLLTFFAVIAGTAEGSGTVDPDLLMMLW